MSFALGFLSVLLPGLVVLVLSIINSHFNLNLRGKLIAVFAVVSFLMGSILQGYWDKCSANSGSDIGAVQFYHCFIS